MKGRIHEAGTTGMAKQLRAKTTFSTNSSGYCRNDRGRSQGFKIAWSTDADEKRKESQGLSCGFKFGA